MKVECKNTYSRKGVPANKHILEPDPVIIQQNPKVLELWTYLLMGKMGGKNVRLRFGKMWSKNKINALVSSGGGAKGPRALFFFKADYL